jgi:hypothetical protein
MAKRTASAAIPRHQGHPLGAIRIVMLLHPFPSKVLTGIAQRVGKGTTRDLCGWQNSPTQGDSAIFGEAAPLGTPGYVIGHGLTRQQAW